MSITVASEGDVKARYGRTKTACAGSQSFSAGGVASLRSI